MGWAEVKKINSDLSTPLDTLITTGLATVNSNSTVPLDILLYAKTLREAVDEDTVDWCLNSSGKMGPVLAAALGFDAATFADFTDYSDIPAMMQVAAARNAIWGNEFTADLVASQSNSYLWHPQKSNRNTWEVGVVDTPTTWVDTGANMPSALYYSHLAVIGDYVYTFGGCTTVEINKIYRASLTDPTTWTDTGSTLPYTVQGGQLAVIGDYVYLFGGTSSNKILRAPVSNPLSWTDTGSTLPETSLCYASGSIAVIGDYVYIFGGHNGAVTDRIYRAPVSNPLSWSIVSGKTLPVALTESGLAVIGDYVYLFGGYASAASNKILRAPVSDPTTWVDTGSTLPSTARNPIVVIIGDYVYSFGGIGISKILRAPLTDPTTWVDTGKTLYTPSYTQQYAIIGNFLYFFGIYEGAAANTIYRLGV